MHAHLATYVVKLLLYFIRGFFYCQQDEPYVRGFREESTSLLSHLYLILRSNRQHRRSFLLSLLRMIDDEKVSKNCFVSLDRILKIIDETFTAVRHILVCSLSIKPTNVLQKGLGSFFATDKTSKHDFLLHHIQKTGLNMLLFIVDSMAYFPFSTLEEPLFIIHNIDSRLSFTGMNILQSFQQVRPYEVFILAKKVGIPYVLMQNLRCFQDTLVFDQ